MQDALLVCFAEPPVKVRCKSCIAVHGSEMLTSAIAEQRRSADQVTNASFSLSGSQLHQDLRAAELSMLGQFAAISWQGLDAMDTLQMHVCSQTA